MTTDSARAKQFYGDTLGLKLISDDEVMFFQLADGGSLMVYERDNAPTADHTLVHWWVDDISRVATGLRAKGVKFERYERMEQDANGISQMGPDGPKAAWFKDPDGNIFGLMQRA